MLRRDAVRIPNRPAPYGRFDCCRMITAMDGYRTRANSARSNRRNEMTQIDETIDTNESPTTNEGTDRRALLRKMAIGGAGAAVAVTALGRTAEAADEQPHRHRRDDHTATLPTTRATTPATRRPLAERSFSVRQRGTRAAAPFAGDVGGYGNAPYRTACTARPQSRPASASSLRNSAARSACAGRCSATVAGAGRRADPPATTSPASCTSTRTARSGSRCRRATTAAPRPCVRQAGRHHRRAARSTSIAPQRAYDSRHHGVHAERTAGAERVPGRQRRRRPQRRRCGHASPTPCRSARPRSRST